MKRIYSTTLLTFFFFGASQSVFANTELAQVEKLYKRACSTCHGRAAEKPAMGESKIINTLNSDEIYTALSDRKSGKIQGAGNMAKSRLTEQEMKSLSEFVPTLKK